MAGEPPEKGARLVNGLRKVEWLPQTVVKMQTAATAHGHRRRERERGEARTDLRFRRGLEVDVDKQGAEGLAVLQLPRRVVAARGDPDVDVVRIMCGDPRESLIRHLEGDEDSIGARKGAKLEEPRH